MNKRNSKNELKGENKINAEIAFNYLYSRIKPHGNNGFSISNPDTLDEITCHELFYSFKRVTFAKHNLFRLIFDFKQTGKKTFDDFLEFIPNIIENDKALLNSVWYFYFPLNIKMENMKEHTYKINNIILTLTNYSSLCLKKKFLSYKDILKINNRIHFVIPVSILSFKLQGKSYLSAINEANKIFSIFKDTIEFIFSWNNYYISNKNKHKMTIVPYNWIIVVTPSDHVLVEEISNKKYNLIPEVRYNKKKRLIAKRLLSRISNNGKPGIKKLLLNSIRLYNQALEDETNWGCFIGFWQLLELFTMSGNHNGKTEIVKKRISWITSSSKKAPININSTMVYFANLRNDIVHRGVDRVSLDDINVVKGICDRAIIWILKNQKHFKNENELELYHKYRQDMPNNVESTKKIADIILSNKIKQ